MKQKMLEKVLIKRGLTNTDDKWFLNGKFVFKLNNGIVCLSNRKNICVGEILDIIVNKNPQAITFKFLERKNRTIRPDNEFELNDIVSYKNQDVIVCKFLNDKVSVKYVEPINKQVSHEFVVKRLALTKKRIKI